MERKNVYYASSNDVSEGFLGGQNGKGWTFLSWQEYSVLQIFLVSPSIKHTKMFYLKRKRGKNRCSSRTGF